MHIIVTVTPVSVVSLTPSLKCAFTPVWQLQCAATIQLLIKVQPKLLHQGCLQQSSAVWLFKGGRASQLSQLQTSLPLLFPSRSSSETTLYCRIYLIMVPSSIRLKGERRKPYTCQVFIPFITWKDQRCLEDEEQWGLLRRGGENKHGRISCGAPEQWNKVN